MKVYKRSFMFGGDQSTRRKRTGLKCLNSPGETNKRKAHTRSTTYLEVGGHECVVNDNKTVFWCLLLDNLTDCLDIDQSHCWISGRLDPHKLQQEHKISHEIDKI